MDKLIAMAKTFGQELTTADEELKYAKKELKELQDIMLNNMTELTSKNELHKECEKLTEEIEGERLTQLLTLKVVKDKEEENEKLKEENEKLEKRVELYAEHNKKLNRDMDESEKYDWKKKYHHLNSRFIALENIEKKLKEHLECEEDGYPTSDWFKEKLDFHIKYHFTNEGGEYYENLKDLKEKPNCLDDLIYGSLERIREENEKLKEEKNKM